MIFRGMIGNSMKVDTLPEKDKDFISMFKDRIKQETTVLKFKRTNNAGAIKSQNMLIFNFAKNKMKTKKDFNIRIGSILIIHTYDASDDTYLVGVRG